MAYTEFSTGSSPEQQINQLKERLALAEKILTEVRAVLYRTWYPPLKDREKITQLKRTIKKWDKESP